MEAPAGGVDDMTKLSYLHEPGVLQNLKSRYELNEIYVRLSSPHYDKIEQSLLVIKKVIFLILSIVMADLYWKYFNCDKSIPKTTSYL